MTTPKQDVEQLLKRLPDDVSIEELQYHLYVIDRIRRGIQEADAGDFATQEEVEREFSKWLDG